MGAIKTIARFGSVAAGAVIPSVYNSRNSLGDAFSIGFACSVFSLFCAIGAACLDRAANDDKQVERE